MGTIDFYEAGLSYVAKCFHEFGGTTCYMAFFLCAVLLLIYAGSKEEKRYFLYPCLILLVTIYNPLVVKFILSKLGNISVYYRFFWMLPIVPMIAWAAVRAWQKTPEKKWARALAIAGLVSCLVLVGCMVPCQGILNPPANRWKISDDLLMVCTKLRDDSSEEYPKAVFEFDDNLDVRQYDAHILLTIDRDVALLFQGSNTVSTRDLSEEEVTNENVIMDCLYNRNVNYDQAVFMQAITATETDYIVISKESLMGDYLVNCGYRLVADTEDSMIFAVTS